ncbi:MAG: MFS transporter [Candidatus Tectomicrobia bacterium]|nr:MFS transporter [Candidatus Tectomicrobia bacterium]
MQARADDNSRFFYGWYVLGASVSVMMFTIGLLVAFGVFLKPMAEDLNWSRTSVAAAPTFAFMTFGVCSFLAGALADRFGTRLILLGGAFLSGLGLFLSALITRPLELYLTFGVLVGFGIGTFYVPLSSLATHWFTKRRGVAVGVVSAGSGIGIMLMSPLARVLITAYGWRPAFMILAGITWLVVFSASLVIRNRPGDVGLSPYGQASDGAPQAFQSARTAGGAAPAPRASSEAIIKHPMFWAIGGTHFFCCLSHSGVLFHMVAMATDIGISKMVAASFILVTGLTSIFSRIGTGAITDRYGLRHTMLLGLVAQTIVIILFRFVSTAGGFFGLTIFFGLAFGGIMPLYVLLSREFFGNQVVGTVYGFVFMLSSFGMSLGPVLGGAIYDYFGNYAWLFFVSGVFGVMAVILASILRPPAVAEGVPSKVAEVTVAV